MEFWRTVMGARFIDATMPALVKAIQELASAVVRLAEAIEKSKKEEPRG